MTNDLLHIKISLDMDKTQAFIKEQIEDNNIATDTILSTDMFEWTVETHCPDGIKLFPVKLKA